MGSRRKAYLITGFALRPELLLLDEPVNGLISKARNFYQKMNEYRKHGTILFSSHVLESLCLTSDSIIILKPDRSVIPFAGDMDPEFIRGY